MNGDDSTQPPQVRVGCTDPAGHHHHLIVVDDRAGLVMVFPPDAWAVLTPPQVTQLHAVVGSHADRSRR